MTERERERQKGVWDEEPDLREWTHAGLSCAVRRMESSGHLCGYVGVGKEHPWYEKGYNDKVYVQDVGQMKVDIDKVGALTMFCAPILCDVEKDLVAIVLVVQVHGGVTFARKIDSWEPKNLWWFGFDCGHCRDIRPFDNDAFQSAFGERVYRTFEFVVGETESMAEQLSGVREEKTDE